MWWGSTRAPAGRRIRKALHPTAAQPARVPAQAGCIRRPGTPQGCDSAWCRAAVTCTGYAFRDTPNVTRWSNSMIAIPFLRLAATCGAALAVAACGTLPDTRFLSERYVKQEARFQTAWGPLSQKKSAALVARLKDANGDLDILDRQAVLEQQIGGSSLVLGNQVTLLEDGPA